MPYASTLEDRARSYFTLMVAFASAMNSSMTASGASPAGISKDSVNALQALCAHRSLAKRCWLAWRSQQGVYHSGCRGIRTLARAAELVGVDELTTVRTIWPRNFKRCHGSDRRRGRRSAPVESGSDSVERSHLVPIRRAAVRGKAR